MSVIVATAGASPPDVLLVSDTEALTVTPAGGGLVVSSQPALEDAITVTAAIGGDSDVVAEV